MDKKTKIAWAIQLTMKLLTKQTEKNTAKKTLPMSKYYFEQKETKKKYGRN